MVLYYGKFHNGEYAFTHEKRIADSWTNVQIVEDPVDDNGGIYQGRPGESIIVKDSAGLIIQPDDIVNSEMDRIAVLEHTVEQLVSWIAELNKI